MKLWSICIENHKRKTPKAIIIITLGVLAEKEGFEPPEAFTSTVFKTAAIDHSAISPPQKYKKNNTVRLKKPFFLYFFLIFL
jgi:hypothetical protein